MDDLKDFIEKMKARYKGREAPEEEGGALDTGPKLPWREVPRATACGNFIVAVDKEGTQFAWPIKEGMTWNQRETSQPTEQPTSRRGSLGKSKKS